MPQFLPGLLFGLGSGWLAIRHPLCNLKLEIIVVFLSYVVALGGGVSKVVEDYEGLFV